MGQNCRIFGKSSFAQNYFLHPPAWAAWSIQLWIKALSLYVQLLLKCYICTLLKKYVSMRHWNQILRLKRIFLPSCLDWLLKAWIGLNFHSLFAMIHIKLMYKNPFICTLKTDIGPSCLNKSTWICLHTILLHICVPMNDDRPCLICSSSDGFVNFSAIGKGEGVKGVKKLGST